jgi:hypothetical protein
MNKENMAYMHTYYSTINENKINSFEGKYMQLVITRLSKIGQTEKEKHCMFSIIYRI